MTLAEMRIIISNALLDVVNDEIDDRKARSICSLSAQYVKSARLEMDAARAFGLTTDMGLLTMK